MEEIKEWGVVGNDRRQVILQSAERRRQAYVDPILLPNRR
jgi:hypothetical protein